MRYVLNSGRVVDAPKDCKCRTHDGPHWLHMDKMWKDIINKFRAEGNLHAAVIENHARLREKAYQMQAQCIAKVIDDAPSDQLPKHTLAHVLRVVQHAIEQHGPNAACLFMGVYGPSGELTGYEASQDGVSIIYLYIDI